MDNLVVVTCFVSAFLLDIAIVIYAFFLSRKMGRDGILSKVTVYAALSALVFGIHHIMELVLENVPHGPAISESVEGIAVILFGTAVFQLYLLTRV